jgi:hypothetical protein
MTDPGRCWAFSTPSAAGTRRWSSLGPARPVSRSSCDGPAARRALVGGAEPVAGVEAHRRAADRRRRVVRRRLGPRGICPGPALVNLGTVSPQVALFVTAIVLGILLQNAWWILDRNGVQRDAAEMADG